MVAVDDDNELVALEHWRRTRRRRTTATDWNTKPFQQPVTASWDQPIPYPELSNLLLGVLPRDMDDRWFIYVDGADAQGNGVLHMYRSWTGFKNFEAKFVMMMDGNGEVRREDGRFTEITWESDRSRLNGVTEEDAKEMVKGVCNSIMDINLP